MEEEVEEVQMQYFDFSSLIKKYITTFTALIPTSGGYDEYGDWQEAEPKKVELQGAIISHRQNKIFRSEGTLTEQDRALYMLEPLQFDLTGTKIIHDGKLYTISSTLENAEFTGVYAYSLKYVSVFDKGGDEHTKDG